MGGAIEKILTVFLMASLERNRYMSTAESTQVLEEIITLTVHAYLSDHLGRVSDSTVARKRREMQCRMEKDARTYQPAQLELTVGGSKREVRCTPPDKNQEFKRRLSAALEAIPPLPSLNIGICSFRTTPGVEAERAHYNKARPSYLLYPNRECSSLSQLLNSLIEYGEIARLTKCYQLFDLQSRKVGSVINISKNGHTPPLYSPSFSLSRPTSDKETHNRVLKVEELDAKTGGTAALDAHHWEDDRIGHGIPENHEKVVEERDQVNACDCQPHEEEVHILDVPEDDVGDRRLMAQEDQQENEPLHKDKYRDFFSLSQDPRVDLHKKMEEVNENVHVRVKTLERASKKLDACLVPQDNEKKEVEVILGNNYEWSKTRYAQTKGERSMRLGDQIGYFLGYGERAQVKPDLRDIGINADSARVGVKDITELVDLEVQNPDRAPERGDPAVTVCWNSELNKLTSGVLE
ncbi:hypothetical protein DL96DRAFT_1562487 [Flagelloscypha sp. PMI_526]|nr:hypothetical protein DL96DRAFT_1562487 [Flagelloscypha sp. PMI_526]